MALDNLGEIMDAIASAITTADTPITLRAQAWPAESVQPPMVVVGYPESIDFDVTFKRGADKCTIPVYFVVGKLTTRAARDAISAVIAGAGSVKELLDGNLGGKVQTLRVTDCRPESIKIGGVDYLAARFDAEVYA